MFERIYNLSYFRIMILKQEGMSTIGLGLHVVYDVELSDGFHIT